MRMTQFARKQQTTIISGIAAFQMIIVLLQLWLFTTTMETFLARHVVERVQITYDPQYWSLVFPLGMYTVATSVFANFPRMQFLLFIPHIAVYVAILAWLITFGAMLLKLANFCLSRGRCSMPSGV